MQITEFTMLPVHQVIARTAKNFPDYAPEDFEVTIVEKGGSDRKFYQTNGRSFDDFDKIF